MSCFFISGKLSVGVFQGFQSTDFDGSVLGRELLVALETARGRLAIAIAEESRSTPWDLRRYYLDTADCMSRCIMQVRKGENNEELYRRKWKRALKALGRIPLRQDTRRLCRQLRNIVEALE